MTSNVIHRAGIGRPAAAVGQRLDARTAGGGGGAAGATEDLAFAFIVGHRKSGSTWLLNLLSLHPEVRGVTETHLFHHGWNEIDPVRRTEKLFGHTPWGEGGMKRWPVRQLTRLAGPFLLWAKPALALAAHERPAALPDLPLRDQLRLRRELRRIEPPEEYVVRFFQFLADRLRPPRYLIEKSPRNIHHVERILALFPAAKLIVIYRDGRDVVVSDRFFTEDYGGAAFSFRETVLRWRRDMEAHLAWAERHPLCAISYERLLADGEPVVRGLLQFLGLPVADGRIADLLERSSFRFYTGRERGQENRRRFYRKGIAGDWKNHFTPEHTRIFKELAGDLLIRLGYEEDMAW